MVTFYGEGARTMARTVDRYPDLARTVRLHPDRGVAGSGVPEEWSEDEFGGHREILPPRVCLREPDKLDHDRDAGHYEHGADYVEDDAGANHLGYRDHAGAVDDGVRGGAHREHKAVRGTEDGGQGRDQGLYPRRVGDGYDDGNDDPHARGVRGGLGDEYSHHRGQQGYAEQAREAQGTGYPVAYGLGESGVGEELAQGDAGAEEQDGAPVYADGVVPGHGEASLSPVDRKDKEECRGEDRHHPLIQVVLQEGCGGGFFARDEVHDAGEDPEGDREPEADKGVALACGEPAKVAALLGDVLIRARDPTYLRAVEEDQDHAEGQEHQDRDRERRCGPLEEGDGLSRLVLDKADTDKVRRAADRCYETAHRCAVGDH